MLNYPGLTIYSNTNLAETAKIVFKLITFERSLHGVYDVADSNCLEYFFDNAVPINIQDVNQNTLLHKAIGFHNYEHVSMLLSRGVDINARNVENITPLFLALQRLKELDSLILVSRSEHTVSRYNKNTQVIIALLDHGADTEELYDDLMKKTLIFYLIDNFGNNFGVFNLFLNRGINIEARSCGHRTPLHSAAGIDSDACMYLLDYGADIEARDARGQTPIFQSVKKRILKNVCLLIKRRANLRARTISGSTVLHVAVLSNCKKTLQMLLDAGADLEARNDQGETPLFMAIKFGEHVSLQYLIEKGANIEAKDTMGMTPLDRALDAEYYAFSEIDKQIINILKTALEQKASAH